MPTRPPAVRRVLCEACGTASSEFDPRCRRCGAALDDASLIGAEPPEAAARPAGPRAPKEAQEHALIGRAFGAYRVEAALGHGAMGAVFRATHAPTGRAVALKLLSPALLWDPGVRARFAREGRALTALRHENVGEILETGEEEGHPYIALALYDAETLAARIAAGPLPLDVGLSGLGGVARGLEAAHAVGIVHRDVKPANVLWLRGGGVKLIDFGLARNLASGSQTSLTQAGTLLGTVAYAAPEQLLGDPPEPSADVWSLGVVLCEALSGKHPFRAGSPALTSARVVSSAPADEALDALPPALREIVLDMCAKAKERRPTAGEVAIRLAAVAQRGR